MKIEGGGNHNRGFQQYLYHIIHTSYVWFETLGVSKSTKVMKHSFQGTGCGVHRHSIKGVPKVGRLRAGPRRAKDPHTPSYFRCPSTYLAARRGRGGTRTAERGMERRRGHQRSRPSPAKMLWVCFLKKII